MASSCWTACTGGSNATAGAIALDPDGHIVVAGTRYQEVNELILLRLTAQGELDPGFGDGGIHASPVGVYGYAVHLARTSAGAYRVAYGTADGCAIAGLTAAGAPDAAFGAAGAAVIPSLPGLPVDCQALALDVEGRLLIAGSVDGKGFAARLLAGGAADTSFDADAAVADDWSSATAVAAAADGKVLVSGSGLRGASIVRLLATGALDAAFGDGGRTWLDLASESAASPNVQSLSLDAEGRVLAAGGDGVSDKPLIVRLQGEGGVPSAGILSAVEGVVSATEADGRAVVHVRRSGGSAGAAKASRTPRRATARPSPTRTSRPSPGRSIGRMATLPSARSKLRSRETTAIRSLTRISESSFRTPQAAPRLARAVRRSKSRPTARRPDRSPSTTCRAGHSKADPPSSGSRATITARARSP